LFKKFANNIIPIKGIGGRKDILTDSAHVKASASAKANIKVQAELETTDYMERLNRYEAVICRRLEGKSHQAAAYRVREKGKSTGVITWRVVAANGNH
jgi:hypothetical protein